MDILYYIRFYLNAPFVRKKIVTNKQDNIFTVDYESYKKQGVKLFIFDVDDTLTAHLDEFKPEVKRLLETLLKIGFKVAAFSNSPRKRTEFLNRVFGEFDIYNVQRSDKPNPAGYSEILDHFKISGAAAVMVGDKIGTDLYGAYLAGIKHRILVKPVSSETGGKKANSIYRLLRKLEHAIHG